MRKKLTIAYYKGLFSLSACIFFLALIYWEWTVFTPKSVKTIVGVSETDKSFFDSLLDYQDNLLSKQEYENITVSPIFIEGRVAIKHDDSLVVQGSSDFKLTGIILSANNLLALITDAKNNLFRLRVGEQANGWTVTSVQKDAVELKRDDQIQNLSLVEPKKIADSVITPANSSVSTKQSPYGVGGYNKPNFY